jgi:calcineurin-like phosphoesterase family protein
MSNVWFSSDYHLGHLNIIKYCLRPFKDLYHMNSTIIRNHNERVKPNDAVFFLGDFCFRNTKGGTLGEGELNKAEEYLSKLNGRFVFIGGNHDDNNSLNTPIVGALLHFGGKSIWCCHNPVEAEDFVDLNLCGHVHQNWKFSKTEKGTAIVNVGVDVWNFRPVDIGEILAELQKWNNGLLDDFGRRIEKNENV